jgi:glutamine synthetase
MKDTPLAMNPNRLVQYLRKPPEEFTRKDLIDFIEGNGIEMVNFRYVGGDGRLKTLNSVITSRAQLDQLLSAGERVDGSSLFSYVDAASSDLYVVPRYRTAYVNPFATVPTLDILCTYYTNEGVPLPSSPENVLRKAHDALKASTGLTLEAMGELEYYVCCDKRRLYPVAAQKGYQESAPFSAWQELRCEVMQAIAQAGGKIKYGHTEVGNISGDDQEMEQHEIEFLPVPLEEAADQMVVAKWMLSMIGDKYGVTVTLAPKLVPGHAGNGLHIHTRLVKDGRNMLVEGGRLSDTARKAIAGYLALAPSLTAFGNTVPISYLRLVPHQEAPTNVCWGDRNRSVLVRVPLGWLNVKDMVRDANPREKGEPSEFMDGQTVEFRSPDGSANVYLLLAGLAVAARHGLEMEGALELADRLYVDVNIFSPEHEKVQQSLPQLPASCWESAEILLRDRAVYEKDGVFPPGLIDGVAKQLRSYEDRGLSQRLARRGDEMKKLAAQYLHSW